MALEHGIINWLEAHSVPLQLQETAGRKAFLFATGIGELCNAIPLEGATTIFCRNVIQYLANYGQLADGRDPLIALLETAKTMIGSDKQAKCDTLIHRLRQSQKSSTRQIRQSESREVAKSPLEEPVLSPVLSEVEGMSKEGRGVLSESSAPQVFICYAREDWEIASQLYDDLVAAGVTPWMDRKNLRPGQKWRALINQAIHQSTYVIALLSSHSVSKRGFVQKELKEALDVVDELPPTDIFVIPVRLDDCDPLDDRLRDLHWVDLFLSYDEGLTQVLQVLCPEMPEPLSTPKPEPSPTQKMPSKQTKPPSVQLRSTPKTVSPNEAHQEFGLKDDWQPRKYLQNDYEDQGEVVLDHATGLMWQKAGLLDHMDCADAQKYIAQLNKQNFAGYNDWRLPTISELMSLFEPERQLNDLFLNPIFETPQKGWHWCWSVDHVSVGASSSESAWRVNFRSSTVRWGDRDDKGCVRAVRS